MPPIAILVALADPTRCRIVEILHAGPQPVHQIAAAFDISRPAISRHLGVLKQARLISEKKTGRENRYQLHPKRLKPIQAWLSAIAAAPNAAPSPTPVALTSTPAQPMPIAAPPARKPAASQMGFDF